MQKYSIFKTLIVLSTLSITFQSCKKQKKEIVYNPKAIEMYNKAFSYEISDKKDSALIFYDKAIALDKTYYVPHTNKALIYAYKNQYEKAIFETEMVIKKKPDLAESFVYLGLLYDKIGKTEKAKKNYEKSIDLFNDRIENTEDERESLLNRSNRAISYFLIGKEDLGKAEMIKISKEDVTYTILDNYLKFNKKDFMDEIFNNDKSNKNSETEIKVIK